MSDLKASASGDGTGAVWQDRKNLLLFGGVGVAVLVAVAAYFLLLSGGGSSDSASGLVANANHPKATTASPTASASASAAAGGVEPLGLYPEDVSRDPFKALYPAPPKTPAAPAAPTSAPATTAATTTNTSTTNTNANTSTTTTNTPPKTTTPPPAATTKTVTIKLVKVIDDKTVTVQVNGGPATAYTTKQVFAGVFSLASTRVDEGEATFNFGDGSPFTLSVGQSKKVVVTS